jgi:pimeloyl-ACP methyl ester carboxylesterase
MDLFRNGSFEELDKAQEAVQGLRWFPYVHRCDRAVFASARRMVGYDNTPSWEGVHCPVLVIYGDKDTSCGSPDELVAIIRRGLARAGNRDVSVKIFPNADHSLCRAATGGRQQATEGARTRRPEDGPDFVPGYLDTMTTWLAERFGTGG